MAGQGGARVPLLCPWSGVRGVGSACITAGCGPEGPGAPGLRSQDHHFVARCFSLCWWHVAILLLPQLQVERRLAALLLAAAAPLLIVGGTLLPLVPCVCSR